MPSTGETRLAQSIEEVFAVGGIAISFGSGLSEVERLRRRGLYELRQPWDHDLPVAHGVFIPPLTTVNAIAVAPSSGLLKREETETGKRCRLSVPASLLSFDYPARTSLKKRVHSQNSSPRRALASCPASNRWRMTLSSTTLSVPLMPNTN